MSVRKIAFILPNFQAGGAERVMITVANHIDRSRFQPLLIVFNDHGPLREMVAHDIAVRNLNVAHVRSGLGALIKSVKELDVDLVISTMAHLNMAVLLAKPFLGGVPVIVREAVTPSYFSGSTFKRNILTLAYHLLYPFADRIVSPTQMVFDEMPFMLRLRKSLLMCIFNPVDVAFIQSALHENIKATYARSDQRLFVGAGRLVDQKGFDRLIDALQEWRTRDDWRLVILGEGSDHDKLQQLITRHRLYQITLAGFSANPWGVFAAADAFVLPSRHEGLPNVALEALAMGVPVIATSSAGGIGEIAEMARDGTVILADDMPAFLAQMKKVTIKAGAFPRPSLLPPCFSLPNVVSSYEQLFTAVLSKKY